MPQSPIHGKQDNKNPLVPSAFFKCNPEVNFLFNSFYFVVVVVVVSLAFLTHCNKHVMEGIKAGVSWSLL